MDPGGSRGPTPGQDGFIVAHAVLAILTPGALARYISPAYREPGGQDEDEASRMPWPRAHDGQGAYTYVHRYSIIPRRALPEGEEGGRRAQRYQDS